MCIIYKYKYSLSNIKQLMMLYKINKSVVYTLVYTYAIYQRIIVESNVYAYDKIRFLNTFFFLIENSLEIMQRQI